VRNQTKYNGEPMIIFVEGRFIVFGDSIDWQKMGEACLRTFLIGRHWIGIVSSKNRKKHVEQHVKGKMDYGQ